MKQSKKFLFVLVLIAIFAYLFYSAYNDIKNRTLNEFNVQQITLAKQASKGVESFFIYYQRELLFLSKLDYVLELNDQGRHLLANFYNNHSDQIEAITLVDSKGILQYTFPYNNEAIGRDISNQEHIRAIIETHKPTVSNVFTSVQGFKTIAYHIPIMAGDKYQGSIAILIPLEKLGKQFIENIKTGETGYGWMISKDGIELYDPQKNQTGKFAKDNYRSYPSVSDLIDKSLKESEGTSICYLKPLSDKKKDLSKTLVAFYRVTLDNTFWSIIIFTPEKEVLAKLISFRNRLYILFSLSILVLGLYFLLAMKARTILKEEKKRNALTNILHESERRFRIIFELSPAGIILIDQEGRIIEVNSAFCETLGYSREELLSNNIRIFSEPSGMDEIEKNITEILSGKTLKHEVTNIRKGGTRILLALHETKIMLPDGKPGILSVANDITEREKVYSELILAKEKAEESDRLKSSFLTNMSHELRTPLNAIIGFSSLMIDAGFDDETTSYLKIIADSGHHLLGLVEEILDISMIETKQIKINYEKIGLKSILYDVKNIISGEILNEKKADIDLILNIDPEMEEIFIFTDVRKLKQVLLNLLKNSLKFTEEGYIEFGFTKIEADKSCFLKFYVKDTGIGIEKKYHDVIFNIFRQVDDTHTRKYGGTGIGLSIASKIIELLGGEIWVESDQGAGSVFQFTIPLVSEIKKLENYPADTDTATENDYSGKTILIAEDEISNYEFLRILFEKMNIRVLWAKNGFEAISLCEADDSINLVLMDIKMPLLNGLEATGRIKQMKPGLTVVAQTAFAMATDKEEAFRAGCDDYLSKPINIGQLKYLLKKYL
jgi:PAS domain S-box-containing protein